MDDRSGASYMVYVLCYVLYSLGMYILCCVVLYGVCVKGMDRNPRINENP